METEEGTLVARERGTPQGGVVSPLLANLFLHYALDAWMRREMRSVRFCRYADDGVIHCQSEVQARLVLRKLGARLRAVRSRAASGEDADRVLPRRQSAGRRIRRSSSRFSATRFGRERRSTSTVGCT